jgi:hypothetical protein
MARTFRKLVNIRPQFGRRFLTVSIPTNLVKFFENSEWVAVDALPGNEKGIIVRPVEHKIIR